MVTRVGTGAGNAVVPIVAWLPALAVSEETVASPVDFFWRAFERLISSSQFFVSRYPAALRSRLLLVNHSFVI